MPKYLSFPNREEPVEFLTLKELATECGRSREGLKKMIKRGISEGRVSKETVNQAVNGAETMIAMGGFTYEQRQLCQMFTLLSRQLGKPKSRY